jgi:hypothetical protein
MLCNFLIFNFFHFHFFNYQIVGPAKLVWVRRNVMHGYLASQHTDDIAIQYWIIPIRPNTVSRNNSPSTFAAFIDACKSFCSCITPSQSVPHFVFPSDELPRVLAWGPVNMAADLRAQLQRDAPFVLGDGVSIAFKGNSPLINGYSATKLASVVKGKANLVNVDGMANKIAAFKGKQQQPLPAKQDETADDDDEWAV